MPDVEIVLCNSPDDVKVNSRFNAKGLRPLIGKYALALVMDVTIIYFMCRTVPDIRSNHSMQQFHWFLFVVFQLCFCVTLVMRYFVKSTQFYATKFHRSLIVCGVIAGIQLAGDFIHLSIYESSTIHWVPFSLAQLVFVFCLNSILRCPCKCCEETPVVQVTYKNKTVAFANQDKCSMKILQSALGVPKEKFVIYDTEEVNYHTKVPFTNGLGRVDLAEERSYIINVAMMNSLDSDFNEDDSRAVHCFLYGLTKRTQEVAQILLDNHPLVKTAEEPNDDVKLLF